MGEDISRLSSASRATELAKAEKDKEAKRLKDAKKAAKSPAKKSSKKEDTPFPEDEGAMKSYSQAIAQQAENNEPDTPIAYEGESPVDKTVKN